MFQPPADVEQQDPSLPAGTIAVDLHDADDRPVSGEAVTLGILINSIAKGDTHKHLRGVTDGQGRTVFSGLTMASNIAYRVSAGYQGGSFAAMPFQLPTGKAMRVVLHVYPVSRSLEGALVAFQLAVEAEARDDRIQIEEALTVYNLGRTAWQPEDVRIALPAAHGAFGSQPSMSDQTIDEEDGAASLHGTFPPGEHSLEFHWQLPLSGDRDVDFQLGTPPRLVSARLLIPAAPGVELSAPDFPTAQVRRDSRGQVFLVTERQFHVQDASAGLISMGLHGLPTPGPGRLIATGLAGLAVSIGIFFAWSPRLRNVGADPGEGSGDLRSALLDELLTIERAHERGAIGPKTYERARRELIDALAVALTQRMHPV